MVKGRIGGREGFWRKINNVCIYNYIECEEEEERREEWRG